MAVVLFLASPALAGVPRAAVQGIVRDSRGVAQMGALVQVLATNRVPTGTAFTDLHGRYVISNLVPGKYEVRATATLFVPAIKDDLQLKTGARTIVNLTLATLFETGTWLPRERHRPDETVDDWKWTMRSPVNRPILRILNDEDSVAAVSGANVESSHGPDVQVHAHLSSGSGFGASGERVVIAVDRQMQSGRDLLLQATAGSSYDGTASASGIVVGYQRTVGLGKARTIVRYQTHPDLGQSGLETFDVRSAQQTDFGDLLQVEMGGILEAVHDGSSTWAAQPFLRLVARPSNGWIVQYRMASSRDVQELRDLDAEVNSVPFALVANGHVSLEQGLHQEISVARISGRGSMQVAVYHDALKEVGVSGIGIPSAAEGAVVDLADGSFRSLARGFATTGANVTIDMPLTSQLSGTIVLTSGKALIMDATSPEPLNKAVAGLRTRSSRCAMGAVSGQLGATRVRATYRWQPNHTVTAVDSYSNVSDGAYLGFAMRHPIRWADHLPPGLEATVDVANLLAQGYRPFLSEDGRTLYFAQTPRTIQAGLSFTF